MKSDFASVERLWAARPPERLLFILHSSGRELDPSYDIVADRDFGDAGLLMFSIAWLVERELVGFDEFMGKRGREHVVLPYKDRQLAAAAFNQSIAEAPYLLVRIAVPNVAVAQDHMDRTNAMQGMIRVLAAAHLHRLETGSFPSEAVALEGRMGGALPKDPFHPDGGPISLKLVDGELRVYSWSENQADDGGHRVPDTEIGDSDNLDLVLRGVVPGSE